MVCISSSYSSRNASSVRACLFVSTSSANRGNAMAICLRQSITFITISWSGITVIFEGRIIMPPEPLFLAIVPYTAIQVSLRAKCACLSCPLGIIISTLLPRRSSVSVLYMAITTPFTVSCTWVFIYGVPIGFSKMCWLAFSPTSPGTGRKESSASSRYSAKRCGPTLYSLAS